MKPNRTTNTKQIRQDLVGFLRSLSDGQPVTVLYRSRPLVTITAEAPELSHQSPDAGTPTAIRRSLKLVAGLRAKQTTRFDANKSFKELYDETRTL